VIFHRDRLPHTIAFEIPHCGAPKVMHDQDRTTCVATRTVPYFAEALSSSPLRRNSQGTILTSLTGLLAPSLQDFAQLGR
jgi:hypothetical protein